MFGFLGSISRLLTPLSCGRPVAALTQVAPPLVVRKMFRTVELFTKVAFATISVKLLLADTAIALIVKLSFAQIDPSVVVVGSGSQLSPPFALRHTRLDTV